MIGLSKEIENAVNTIINGLEYQIDINEVEPEKMKKLMKSKIDSFKYAKTLINKWSNSSNSPNNEKLETYINRLVSSGDVALSRLREYFNLDVNYSEIPEDKHYLVSESKVILLDAIYDIDSSLIELRLQLESGNYQLDDKEFEVGFPEKFANQEFYPLKEYHKNWYDTKTKSIIICPKGSIGEIITLDKLNIALPEIPKDTSKILFYNEKKRNQYWRRTPMPKGITPDNQDSHYEYIMQEFKRRREGVWFMNNGIPTYLTGSHYFALQWCKMLDDGGYMDYRDAQAKMFYHTEACVQDKRCLGQLFVKSRRTGYTYEKVFRLVNESTSTKNANFGITSKSDSDAKKAYLKYTYAVRNLPFFFIPVYKTTLDSPKQIEFAKPSDRSKKAKKEKNTNTDDYLNTLIDYQPTKDDSYDGQKMFRYLGDEAFKWKRPNDYLAHWGQISPTFDEGGKIVGKAFIGSTMGAHSKGGEQGIKLIVGSNPNKRDPITERTPTGLYSYFLPAQDNMTEFTDKYGVCHKVVEEGGFFENVQGDIKRIGSVQYLEAQNSQKRREGEIEYNEQLRAFPMKIEDALRDESSPCLFNMEKIQEQIQYCRDTDFANIVKRGNFAWKDGMMDTKVVWRPNPKGKFKVTWMPPKDMQNAYETRAGYGGHSKSPLNDEIGAFGCDSYDISGTVDSVNRYGYSDSDSSKGSKGALHGVTKFSMSDVPSNHFFLQYIARPKTAEEFFEDVLMACVFYGMPILAENNKPRLLYHFKNRGYRNFSITRFDKPINKISQTEKELGGIPNSSQDVMQMHASSIEDYVEKNVGYNLDTNDYGSMFFQETLEDWLKFDITKRTKFDASISSGLALMAINRTKYKPTKERKSIKMNIKRKR